MSKNYETFLPSKLVKIRFKYFKRVTKYIFFSLLSFKYYINFHIESYCDDLDEKGPHIFGQKFEIPAIVQPQP